VQAISAHQAVQDISFAELQKRLQADGQILTWPQ